MKATNEKKAEGYSSPYNFEGRIPLSQAIPLGLQHVMAMFIGNLTPLIIVMGVCGLTADAGFGELRTALLQNAMIIAGVVTLVQMFSIGPVGGKVPIVIDIVLTVITAIASVQMIVAIAVFGQNNWDATWLPIQAGMFLLGVTWDVMFIAANFPTFERK